MDEAARKVLKAKKAEINRNLILEDSILDELEQEDILTENMVWKIKAKATNEDKISELLFFLPKRGPRAFETFIEAIRKDFHFLADMLDEALNEELDKEGANQNSSADNIRNSSDVSMETLSDRSSPEETTDVTQNDFTQTDGPDLTIRSQASDKSFYATNVRQNDFTQTDSLDLTIRSQASDKSFYATNVQQNLNSFYTKLKSHMTSSSLRELSFQSPQPVTFGMIDNLLEDLLTSQSKCYSILGQTDRSSSLLFLINNIMEKNKTLESELQSKEDQRNKYCHHINKLEQKCRDGNVKVDNLKKDKLKLSANLEKLKQENQVMDEKLKEKYRKQITMESELEILREQLEQQKGEYECRMKDYEAQIAQYKKELNKSGDMFVSGRNPFRENKWRNDPTPSYANHTQDQQGYDTNIQRNPEFQMKGNADILKGRQSTTAKKDDAVNTATSNIANTKGKLRKPHMTPHMTNLYHDTPRGRPAGNATPLTALQIVNTAVNHPKPCMPVTSTVSISPRTKPAHGKPVRHLTKKQ